MKTNQCWPKALESQSPESQRALAQSVGESKSRIPKSVGPKRWRVEVPNLKAKFSKLTPKIMNTNQCWPKALECHSPESQRALAPSVGESRPRISKSVGPKRWSVDVPNLKSVGPKR